MQRLEVAVLPDEAFALDADCYVVIDALRATTTAVALFGAGLHDLVAVDSIELARELARRDGRLLFGEVNGLPPRGFDYGNSPVEAADAPVAGGGAVLFTTNGTKALCAFAERGSVLAGAVGNATALVQTLAQAEVAVLVCAGNEGGQRFALEDFLCAGALANLAAETYPGLELGDAAVLAIAAAASGDLARRFAETRHGRDTAARGFAADIEFAALPDTSAAVPAVIEYGTGWVRLIDFAAG